MHLRTSKMRRRLRTAPGFYHLKHFYSENMFPSIATSHWCLLTEPVKKIVQNPAPLQFWPKKGKVPTENPARSASCRKTIAFAPKRGSPHKPSELACWLNEKAEQGKPLLSSTPIRSSACVVAHMKHVRMHRTSRHNS